MDNLEITGICRFCLSQPINLNDLFNSSNDIDLVEAIQAICGINIYPANYLPDQICDYCIECLKASYNFRIRTQQSDKTLRSILEGSIIVKEYITDDDDEPEVSNHTEDIKTEEDSQNDETNENADEELAFALNMEPGTDLQCHYCKKNFVHQKNMRVHMRRHFTEGNYRCYHCSNKYHTKFHLHRHMTKIHSDGLSYKCDLCIKEFPTKPELNRHLKTHESKKSFACSECGMQFKLKHNAQQHVRWHLEKKPFSCEICGKGFAFACKLKNHNKSKCNRSTYTSFQKAGNDL